MGTQKGRDIHERTKRNFGMTHPEGYRKAMRVMEIAERHRFPVISLIDTPGAYPGVAAEQHGQGGAIARSQALMARLSVPIVACVIGEGSSGGAVAIGLADRVLMQENAIYVVISPEGCAAILWRDAGEREKAAAAFRPDAVHCLELGDHRRHRARSRRAARTPTTTRPPSCSRPPSRPLCTRSKGLRATSSAGAGATAIAPWACSPNAATEPQRRVAFSPQHPQCFPPIVVSRTDTCFG